MDAICTGVQPGELPASVDAAEVGEALVADHAAGEADQDRCESRSARQVRDVPDGRSGGATGVDRSDPGAYPAVRSSAAVGAAWLTIAVERKVDGSCGDEV